MREAFVRWFVKLKEGLGVLSVLSTGYDKNDVWQNRRRAEEGTSSFKLKVSFFFH